MWFISSLETQGQSVGSGEKAGRKFSSTGERAPGYRLSPSYFQNFKRMPAPDWAQKMLCIIVPNRRTVSPEFFSWVRKRRLLSHHTCPVRSPSLCVQGKLLFYTFLTRNKGATDESKKRLGCKTTTLQVHHAFLYISLPSTARLSLKMPNFTFCGERKQATTKFILLMNLDMVDRNSAPEEFACI